MRLRSSRSLSDSWRPEPATRRRSRDPSDPSRAPPVDRRPAARAATGRGCLARRVGLRRIDRCVRDLRRDRVRVGADRRERIGDLKSGHAPCATRFRAAYPRVIRSRWPSPRSSTSTAPWWTPTTTTPSRGTGRCARAARPCRLWRIHRHIGMGGDQIVSALAGEEFEDEHGDAVRDAEAERYKDLIGEVQPLPGARELVIALKKPGHSVVLASSAKEDEVEHYVDLLDARELADSWTTSADVEATKPAPDLVESRARPRRERERRRDGGRLDVRLRGGGPHRACRRSACSPAASPSRSSATRARRRCSSRPPTLLEKLDQTPLASAPPGLSSPHLAPRPRRRPRRPPRRLLRQLIGLLATPLKVLFFHEEGIPHSWGMQPRTWD